MDSKNWQWLNLGQDTDQTALSDAIANGVPGTYSIGGDVSPALGRAIIRTGLCEGGLNPGLTHTIRDFRGSIPPVFAQAMAIPAISRSATPCW